VDRAPVSAEAAQFEDLPGLGPATAAMLREAGIADPAALRAMGAAAAWRRLRFVQGRRVRAVAFYALHGALAGRDGRAPDVAGRAALRRAAGS
jgi:DNA transformation protein